MERSKKQLFSDKKRSDYIFVYGIIAWPFLVWLFFFLLTNIESIALAFEKIDVYGNTTFYAGNFKDAFDLNFRTKDSPLMTGFVNSLKYWFWTNVFCFPITFTFSYLIWKKIYGFRIMRLVIMVPHVISGFVMTMIMKVFINGPLVSVFQGVGLNVAMPLRNPQYTLGILIFYTCWSSFGFSCLMYSNAMKEIDESIVESYHIDGVSGMWSEIWHICLPGTFQTISTFIITASGSFLMTGGPLLAFYMYNAPTYVYSATYYFTLQIYNVGTNYSGYPVITAAGFMISFVTIPVVYLTRFLLNKYGPSEE